MWVLFALASAVFAGLTSVLAKAGVQNVNSNLATAIRTTVVLIFAWLIAAGTGTLPSITNLSPTTWLFLVLSGLATGGSWLCYFRALQLGDVNKVVPVDKSSIILTVIFAFIFLGESVTPLKVIGLIAIAIGTWFMVMNKPTDHSSKPSSQSQSHTWLYFALASAVFAALTSILGKVGIEGVDSNLGTAIRTTVVLVLAWAIAIGRKDTTHIKDISRFELLMLVLSGIATGASWLCFYHALQIGPASGVVPVDKLSVGFAILFAYFAFGERLTKRSAIGLAVLIAGTILMVV